MTTTTKLTAMTDLNVTLPSPLNTVIGYMVFSDMRLPAPVTGLAGTEPPPNNSVLVDFSTMRKPMPVIGHPMCEAAKSTLFVLRILMPTYPSAPHVKDTGPAKEDTHVSSVAQPLSFSTNSPADVCLLLLRIVKPQQLQNHLSRKDRLAMVEVPLDLNLVPRGVLLHNPFVLNKAVHLVLNLNSVPNLSVQNGL